MNYQHLNENRKYLQVNNLNSQYVDTDQDTGHKI